jgi:hypothetical protein
MRTGHPSFGGNYPMDVTFSLHNDWFKQKAASDIAIYEASLSQGIKKTILTRVFKQDDYYPAFNKIKNPVYPTSVPLSNVPYYGKGPFSISVTYVLAVYTYGGATVVDNGVSLVNHETQPPGQIAWNTLIELNYAFSGLKFPPCNENSPTPTPPPPAPILYLGNGAPPPPPTRKRKMCCDCNTIASIVEAQFLGNIKLFEDLKNHIDQRFKEEIAIHGKQLEALEVDLQPIMDRINETESNLWNGIKR